MIARGERPERQPRERRARVRRHRRRDRRAGAGRGRRGGDARRGARASAAGAVQRAAAADAQREAVRHVLVLIDERERSSARTEVERGRLVRRGRRGAGSPSSSAPPTMPPRRAPGRARTRGEVAQREPRPEPRAACRSATRPRASSTATSRPSCSATRRACGSRRPYGFPAEAIGCAARPGRGHLVAGLSKRGQPMLTNDYTALPAQPRWPDLRRGPQRAGGADALGRAAARRPHRRIHAPLPRHAARTSPCSRPSPSSPRPHAATRARTPAWRWPRARTP